MALDSNPTLASRPVKEVYAVSRLVREAKRVLEGSFPLTWVEGEISNLAMPASGHIYFTLKDEAAQVRCAMFRTRNRNLRFTPKNGLQVLLRVRVTLYEGRGEFQCVVEHMEEAGSGALQRAYEALKHRLGDEGLFDSEHKKILPALPQRIGIISSPDGAAVHDILTVLNRRFPAAKVILYPVAVQGTDSAKQITKAIKLAEKRNECDVLIMSRGGGSLEDLWSFNDEQLARSIFACKLPIISAVGHEVDFTIADFVADVRAATPSAAAELAVPDGIALLNQVSRYSQRLLLIIKHLIQTERNQLKLLKQGLTNPLVAIGQNMQSVDRIEQRLHRAWRQIVKDKQQQAGYWTVRLTHPQAKIDAQQHRLLQLSARLEQQVKKGLTTHQYRLTSLLQRFQSLSLLNDIQKRQADIEQTNKVLTSSIQQKIDGKRALLSAQMRTLAAVSPLSTLERGYSITTSLRNNEVLLNSKQAEVGQHVNVQLQQGKLHCQITKIKHD
jgi:exodeoxyribonuclease VII large subunit